MTAAERIQHCAIDSWSCELDAQRGDALCVQIERGAVILLPRLPFPMLPGEERFLSDAFATEERKNVNIRPGSGRVRGARGTAQELEALGAMVGRYAAAATRLIDGLFPRYRAHRRPGPTSFRPCRVEGRAQTWRSDDTRMHVDAFPSNPMRGRRILRVFSNVNPASRPRMWNIGEPFAEYARRFLPRAKREVPGSARLLAALGVTKSRRSAYDHLMLQLHDAAKADLEYQRSAPRLEFGFPAGSTWIVFTDEVVHAATAGQFAFEQTLYLDVEGMLDRSASPLAILEGLTGRNLI
jgi:hypothetical protein